MKTTSLGRTGLQVSEIVFGGGFVGGILLHASDEIRRDVLQMAMESGINWIDTAASYGKGQSEEVVGWLLKELPDNKRPQVSTKFAVDPNGGDYVGQIRRSLDQSLRRLQMESVSLLQLHNQIGEDSHQLPLNEILRSDGVLDALDQIRSEGLTNFVGFTALGDACLLYGVGVLGIRVYAAGILASRVQHGREIPVTSNADYESELKRADCVRNVLGEVDGTDAQKALRFVLDQDHIDGAVIGLAELSHLREAIGATQLDPLSSSIMERLKNLWDRNYQE